MRVWPRQTWMRSRAGSSHEVDVDGLGTLAPVSDRSAKIASDAFNKKHLERG